MSDEQPAALDRISVYRAGESIVVAKNDSPFMILTRETAVRLGSILCKVAYWGVDTLEDDASSLDP